MDEVRSELREYLDDDYGDIEQFIWDISESTLEELYPKIYSQHFNIPEEFVGLVYHQTPSSNLDSIKLNGLNPTNKTRGITNKGTGAAVFTSIEIDDSETYGDLTIEIDLELARNINPEIETQLEEPILDIERRKALALDLGEDPDNYNISYSDGIYDTTLVIYGNIPKDALRFL